MSSDLLTKRELTSWTALHPRVSSNSAAGRTPGGREDFRGAGRTPGARGMQGQIAWGLLSAGQPGPSQLLPVAQP